jgi:hypothetical protein
MGRVIRDWKPDRVEDAQVAPHRYLWSGAILPSGERAKDLDLCDNYDERKANVPYGIGDVVYIERGASAAKARIVGVYWRRNYHHELVETYRIQVETASGLWSKLWEMTHPGFIQRGYQRAGLAPDIPANA